MAVRRQTVRTCDRCGRDGASTWVVTDPDGDKHKVDLCEVHAAPLKRLVVEVALAVPRKPEGLARIQLVDE